MKTLMKFVPPIKIRKITLTKLKIVIALLIEKGITKALILKTRII